MLIFGIMFGCGLICAVLAEHEGEVTVVDISEDGLKVLAGTSAVSSFTLTVYMQKTCIRCKYGTRSTQPINTLCIVTCAMYAFEFRHWQ